MKKVMNAMTREPAMMLTAMAAVDDIQHGRTDKSNIWNVNVEQEYHEEKAE